MGFRDLKSTVGLHVLNFLAGKSYIEGSYTEAFLSFLIGSALTSGRFVLELAGIGSSGHVGNFWQFLTEATPVAPPLPKPGHRNPIQLMTEF
ncbi:hypothetical protein WISP_118077 [Willisornis vidua]|uniref:Uncharacterized protein n=1 Tax=Willisornis vidua TaxID=1566151 RepID=A0ABQ9CT73_9PASS|nr:hypothetical protein WISP_118077 [Willisornis vidua]